MENFKAWFNANYSLCLDGIWKSIDYITNLSLFQHKFNKVLSSTSRYGSRLILEDVIIMRVFGQTCPTKNLIFNFTIL